MLKKNKFLNIFFFILLSCGKKDGSEQIIVEKIKQDVTEQDIIKHEIVLIKENLSLINVNLDTWSLILVGALETYQSNVGLVTSNHFEKLKEGETIYDLLNPEVQRKIIKVNDHFAGDVIVYDSSLNPKPDYLNDIDTELGKHKLALIHKTLIPQLHSAGFGKNYWLTDLVLEAFSLSVSCNNPTTPSDDSYWAICDPNRYNYCSQKGKSYQVYCAKYQSWDIVDWVANTPLSSGSNGLGNLSCINPYNDNNYTYQCICKANPGTTGQDPLTGGYTYTYEWKNADDVTSAEDSFCLNNI